MGCDRCGIAKERTLHTAFGQWLHRAFKSHIRLALVDNALGERAELQFVEHLAQCHKIHGHTLQCILVPVEWHIGLDGGKVLRQPDLLGIIFHLRLQCAFQFIGVAQQIFNGAELLNEFFRRFRTHAGAAGNVVGRVAHQSEQVNHLNRVGQTVLLLHLFHAHDFIFTGIVDFRAVVHQLPKILVTRHHIGFETVLAGDF